MRSYTTVWRVLEKHRTGQSKEGGEDLMGETKVLELGALGER